jgi:hypothetical protein
MTVETGVPMGAGADKPGETRGAGAPRPAPVAARRRCAAPACLRQI